MVWDGETDTLWVGWPGCPAMVETVIGHYRDPGFVPGYWLEITEPEEGGRL